MLLIYWQTLFTNKRLKFEKSSTSPKACEHEPESLHSSSVIALVRVRVLVT